MTDDTWHLVRNIRGVTGFVGEANKAIPLTEDEVAALGMEKHEIVVLYQVGDTVRITDGPWPALPARWRRSTRTRIKCPCGGLHVRPRNAGGAGAGSGRGQQQLSTAQPVQAGSTTPAQVGEMRVSAKTVPVWTGRYHILLKEVPTNGTESSWIRQTADPCGQRQLPHPPSAPLWASTASTLPPLPRSSTSAPRTTWA